MILRPDCPVANLCNSRAKLENEMNCRPANQTAPDRPWAVCRSVFWRGRIDLRAVCLRGRGRFTVSNPDGVELQRLVVSIE